MNARALSVSATASDFLSLTKPRLSSLVLVTTAGGMWLSPSGLSPARQIASLLAVAGLVAGGCGKAPPPLGKVRGKVTYKGKPVTFGHVNFMPTAGLETEAGQPSSGDIRPDG